MLTSRVAADRRRCEGTITTSAVWQGPESRAGAGVGWGQAFI
jgi:hypothetical protein